MDLRRTVNEHRYLDADIELQLIHELKALLKTKCNIEIFHVEGHQYSTARQNLTDEEKLNVDAEELTHIARKLPDIKLYYKFPTNKVNFRLNNQYVNSHYLKMTNLAFHSMALREYYARKHGWPTKS
jgi:hypothetical protein